MLLLQGTFSYVMSPGACGLMFTATVDQHVSCAQIRDFESRKYNDASIISRAYMYDSKKDPYLHVQRLIGEV